MLYGLDISVCVAGPSHPSMGTTFFFLTCLPQPSCLPFSLQPKPIFPWCLLCRVGLCFYPHEGRGFMAALPLVVFLRRFNLRLFLPRTATPNRVPRGSTQDANSPISPSYTDPNLLLFRPAQRMGPRCFHVHATALVIQRLNCRPWEPFL